MKNETLLVEGYQWFGHNRDNLHVNARKSSWGVGFLIKSDLLKYFKVCKLDSTFEGILWLQLKSKTCDIIFNICVCYLPPLISWRQIDAQKFYDCLLTNIYEYQNQGKIFICGYFNSRCGDIVDFIEGIDDLDFRDVIDFNVNKYGHLLIDFLLNNNMCILNGRKSVFNDFTCITSAGRSVVDYCLVSHDDLNTFSDFKVCKVTDVINEIGHETVLHSASFPDHSISTWQIKLDLTVMSNESTRISENLDNKTFVKYDTKNIPDDFMSNDNFIQKLHETVFKLESDANSQNDLDKAYAEFSTLIRQEMTEKLDSKTIKMQNSSNNKKRKIAEPWWNDDYDLTAAWNEMCMDEKNWLKSKHTSRKKELKRIYISKRKIFDKMVQRSKRSYWYKIQNDILNEADHENTVFWKRIGKVGKSSKRNIPMEVILDDGSTSSLHKDVLEKWKTCFSSLYDNTEPIVDEAILDNTVQEPLFDDMISLTEVQLAVKAAKLNKASGADSIPVEIYKNDTAISCLHILFNVCFRTGNIPSEWGKGIINPIPKSNNGGPRDPLSYRGFYTCISFIAQSSIND